jgi:hypothetical protein
VKFTHENVNEIQSINRVHVKFSDAFK